MARFARDCREQMNKLVSELEPTLGPGTGDLKLRIGLHSGPTTAGVLRGEKGRFQLFGDTVNTASRMESNGIPMRIQVSQKTADLLNKAGKEHWLTAREDKVHAKGKGEMQTYWCEPKTGPESSFPSGEQQIDSDVDEAENTDSQNPSYLRLVSFHTELFEGLLKRLVASRKSSRSKVAGNCIAGDPRGYVTEYVRMKKNEPLLDPKNINLDEATLDQLNDFIKTIASRYHDTPFHNLDHCSHVTMAVKKLLDRIDAQERDLMESENERGSLTFGITTDELAKFAMMFSAFIHDVDHRGVANAQLVDEMDPIATKYDGKSVAEQNSVDIAWSVLMQDKYSDLRQSMFASEDELRRFHQLVSNIVMSTDLFDGELRALRENRWKSTFSKEKHPDIPIISPDEQSHRKATVILELIIQASDVSHTMQHFTIYKKWNMRLLEEMYTAYKAGRSTHNPFEGWYEGEIGFFDFYIIPLAKKLKECNVFGVSCDEFLSYAMENRMEWEMKGKDIVYEARKRLEFRSESESAENASTAFEI